MIKKEYKIPTQKAIEIEGKVFMDGQGSASPEQPSSTQRNNTSARNSLFNDEEDYDW